MSKLSVIEKAKASYSSREAKTLSIEAFLDLCKSDPAVYRTAQERMRDAFGSPKLVDTRLDGRLSRIHSNRVIKEYEAFADFYGMENVVEEVASFFRQAANGMEESKQVLYLLGPVGGGKSSLAERLKKLMEKNSFYTIRISGEISPVNDNPLALIMATARSEEAKEEMADLLESEYGISRRYTKDLVLSPWAVKRLDEVGGDISAFEVLERYPDQFRQIALAKTEPGDENNQDVSALIGKTDIRKLELYSESDPDAYSYSGGLCVSNRGMLEFVEMFKAPIKVLHPLLTATQEKNFKPSENGIGPIPFDGIVLAHSNESEWQGFKGNKNNEAFLDRVKVVKVPYALRTDEEEKIYKKLLAGSSLSSAPCVPETLKLLSQFCVLSRLSEPGNSSIHAKMRVYNGENIKDTDPKAKSLKEYKDDAPREEGMSGISTRTAYKILSRVFDYHSAVEKPSADPVTLFTVLDEQIAKGEIDGADEERMLANLSWLREQYKNALDKKIQAAYLENSEYAQNIFDTYVQYADHWLQDQDYRDPNTGMMLDRASINAELEKIEKPGGVNNPRDFRNEVVSHVLRHRAKHDGANPSWRSYQKMAAVIEKKIQYNTDEMRAAIGFEAKRSPDEAARHAKFLANLEREGGYVTEHQKRRAVEWYLRLKNAA